MKRVSMKDLYQETQNLTSDELILDVRTPAEYSAGHIPGAKNIPHDKITGAAQELKKYRKIFIHCQAGGRAQAAAEVMQKLGFDNLVCVAGSGMPDWIKAGYPVEQ